MECSVWSRLATNIAFSYLSLVPCRAFLVLFHNNFSLRRHRHPRTHPLKAVDNDLLSRLKSGTNDAFAFHRRTEFHRAIYHGVGGRESEYEFLALVCANRAFLDQQGGVALAQGDANAREQTRHDAPVR